MGLGRYSVMFCNGMPRIFLRGSVGAYHVRLLALSIKSLYNYSLIWGAASKSHPESVVQCNVLIDRRDNMNCSTHSQDFLRVRN